MFCALMVLSTSVVAMGYSGSNQSSKGNAIAADASLLFGTSQTNYSLNWAGYAVVSSANSVSLVTESFLVPDPVVSSTSGHANSINVQNKPGGNGHGPGGGGSGGGSSSTSYAAFWAGMDGYSSSTVEQAGIIMNVSSSGTTYAAWTEFYPAAPTYAPASFGTIGVGDTVTVTVLYLHSSNRIYAYVNDTTSHGSYSNYHSASTYQRNSAEWIAEAPSSGHSILPLADFVTVTFGQFTTGISSTNSAVVGGHLGSIGALFAYFPVYQINMVQHNGTPMAVTSGLFDKGTTFEVNWSSS